MLEEPNMVREKFFNMKSREDVADILGIKEKSLRYFLYSIKPDNMYVEFSISKKNGGERVICAPNDKLKAIQRKLAVILNMVYKTKPAAHGFVLDKNVATNAKGHVKKKYVFNIDLENFFDQIHFGRVRGMLMKPPYNLGEEAALVISQIACYKGKLPQGAPTSPILTNMVCAPLDTQLTKLAKKYNLQYSRYADDITFSTYKADFPVEIAYVDFNGVHVGTVLEELIKKNNFLINYNKVRISDYRQRQIVTGLVVNQFVNLRRDYIKEIRALLYSCKVKGLLESAKLYVEKGKCKNPKIIEAVNSGKSEKEDEIINWFLQVLKGKIEYIKSIRGDNNPTYLKYASELNRVSGKIFFRVDEYLDFIKQIEKSVFIIEINALDDYIQGSGFLLDPDLLLTNHHVTKKEGFYKVTTFKEDQIGIISNDIKFLKRNENIDYACYNGFGREDLIPWELGDSDDIKIGSKIIMIGYPDYNLGNTPDVQTVYVTGERTFMGQKLITVSGRIVHGASVGVVLNEEHKVIGMIRCGVVSYCETDTTNNHGFIPINDIMKDIKS